jgi:hypothetical protein
MTPEQQQRRTLEMCAKACGIAYTCYSQHSDGGVVGLHRPEFGLWNPLANTVEGRSQCAEMCAELGIDTEWQDEGVVCSVWLTQHETVEDYDDHPSNTAAWQAAACAVAAAIGEAKEQTP